MKKLFLFTLTVVLAFGLSGLLNAQTIPIEVTIDIRPCSETNPVVLNGNGIIPVAILTTDDFDATTVDPTTVVFGPGEAETIRPMAFIMDIDKDGDMDMLLLFKTRDAGFVLGDKIGCIKGETYDGTAIEGCDLVTVIDKPKCGPGIGNPQGPKPPNGPNGPEGPGESEGSKGAKKAPSLGTIPTVAWGKIKANR